RELGLTVDIDEKVASRIWANLLIVDGRFEQGKSGHYTKMAQATEYLQAIYHAIAKCLVDENTTDDVIEQTIPDIAVAFFSKTGGRFFTCVVKQRWIGKRKPWKVRLMNGRERQY